MSLVVLPLRAIQSLPLNPQIDGELWLCPTTDVTDQFSPSLDEHAYRLLVDSPRSATHSWLLNVASDGEALLL